MQAVKSKDTAPELFVRSLLHARGYRYRLHRKDLPGCPDLVFPGRRKVIFIHGCPDGQREYPLREEYLAGTKRLERHQAVRNNVRFWVHVLTHRDLFDERRELLAFQLPLQFQTDFGIPDPDWLSNADAEERERVGVEDEEISKRIVADREQLSLIHEA